MNIFKSVENQCLENKSSIVSFLAKNHVFCLDNGEYLILKEMIRNQRSFTVMQDL